MTNRFVNPIIKYTTSTLKTMPGAELYFTTTGTSTPRVTYQDFNGTIPHAHPVVALSDGHFPPIFLDGTYRAELKYLGVTQPGWPVDNIGATNAPAPLDDWNSAFSYSTGQLVTAANGNRYESLQDNNLNNEPSATPLYWSQIFLNGNVDTWQQLDIAARSGAGPKADAESAIRYSLDMPEPTAAAFVRGNADGSYVNRNYGETRQDLSIDNTNNTSDANKPISTATQAALDLKASINYVNTLDLFELSDAEIATSVTPTNFFIPSNIIGVVLQKRYATYADAVLVADNAGLPIIGTGAGNITTNVTFGRGAMAANTTGSFNIAIGRSALAAGMAGDNNIAIGYNALTAYIGATGSLQGQNTVVGSNSAYTVTTGGNNTVVGNNAFMEATTASYCTAIGQGALAYHATNVSYSVGVGYHALLRCKAAGNTAVGTIALGSNGGADLTGIANTALGYFALASTTSGATNTAVGYEASLSSTTASDCTAIGHGALNANNANGLTAIGKSALVLNTSGTGNTAVGRASMQSNLTGSENTAVGENSLLASTGNSSVAVGKNALQSLTNGANCVGVGHSALANVTGTANTSLGFETGLGITTGDSNTMIGFRADSILASTNATSVGNTASCIASNQVTLGNASVSSLRCQATSITSLSDRRDKTEIEPLDLGLDFINAVKVRKYIWDRRDGSCSGVAEAGIIAQELQDLQRDFDAEWLNMVLEVNPERLEATPHKMLFPLIKAVQELSQKVDSLQSEINVLKHS